MIPTNTTINNTISSISSGSVVSTRMRLRVLSLHACCALRFFGYSAYNSIRKPPKRSTSSSHSHEMDNKSGDDNYNQHKSSSYYYYGHNKSKSNHQPSHNTNHIGGIGVRTTQKSSQRRRESKQIFPETLKSGRYKQQNTKSQRLYTGPISSSYNNNTNPPDRRFFRKLQDYREVQDDDPYAGVFSERASVQKRRVKEWQRQFEEENADVELPYERTNVIARLAPNWFVRFFINMRDRGGVDHLGYLFICMFITAASLWAVGCLLYTPPSRSRPIAEVR
ncbi:hypothetical protein LSM04_005567 [Trypanosoma melophagium]|uniref:uncharacterized protein n=1 Tax=Trypanosoma melophagium TaxID=715481 RepID=UPI00351A60A4|nr:hypothetical protein LSM04_005567 [Trypanosoma melophagium]